MKAYQSNIHQLNFKPMKKHNIPTFHRALASVLLISQLLTSCGGGEIIVPRHDSSTSIESDDKPAQTGGLDIDQPAQPLLPTNDRGHIKAYFDDVKNRSKEQKPLQLKGANNRLYELIKNGKEFSVNVYTQQGTPIYHSLPVYSVSNYDLVQELLRYPAFPTQRIQLIRDSRKKLGVAIGFQGLRGGMHNQSTNTSHRLLRNTDYTSVTSGRDSEMIGIPISDDSNDKGDNVEVGSILDKASIEQQRPLALEWLCLDTLFDVLQIGTTVARYGLVDTLACRHGVGTCLSFGMAIKDLGEDLKEEYSYQQAIKGAKKNHEEIPTREVASTLGSYYRSIFPLYKYGKKVHGKNDINQQKGAISRFFSYLNSRVKHIIHAKKYDEKEEDIRAKQKWLKGFVKDQATLIPHTGQEASSSNDDREIQKEEIEEQAAKIRQDLDMLDGYYRMMNEIQQQQDTFSFVDFEYKLNKMITLVSILTWFWSFGAAIHEHGGVVNYGRMLYHDPQLSLLNPFFIGLNGAVTLGVSLIKMRTNRKEMKVLHNTLNRNIYQEARRVGTLYQAIDKAREARRISQSCTATLENIRSMVGADKLIDATTWGKMGIHINHQAIPPIPQAMLRTIASMMERKEAPMAILDPGISMVALDEYLKRSSYSASIKFKEVKPEEDWHEQAFAQTTTNYQWIVMPTSDGGILPGTRNTAYTNQVRYMHTHYPKFKVLKGRELAIATIGSALINPDSTENRLLVDVQGDGKNIGKGWGGARCEELWSYKDDKGNRLRVRMGKFNVQGLYISNKDKDNGNEAYTDYGLAAGVKFGHTIPKTFNMSKNALLLSFKDKLTTENMSLDDIINIGKRNFKDVNDPSLTQYEKAYKLFLEVFNVNHSYTVMLKEIVQSFSEQNESYFNTEEEVGKKMYEHLVFQVFTHLLQDQKLEVYFRTPKGFTPRIWVSLAELADTCKLLPEDPTKKPDKTSWKSITKSPEDQAWLKDYLAKYADRSATIGVSDEGTVFLNSNINTGNNPDYSSMDKDEIATERVVKFKRALRKFMVENKEIEDQVVKVTKSIIEKALADPSLLYKHIKQYMYFNAPIDDINDDWKIPMWHHQHQYMDSIARKNSLGRYAIDTGGVTRTFIDKDEVEKPIFAIMWE